MEKLEEKLKLDERWQTEAYEVIKSDFQKGNRSSIVAPTGAGKSALGIQLFEDNRDKQIVYVSSSPIINAQIRKKVKEIYGKPFEQVFPNVTFQTYRALSGMEAEEFNKMHPELIIYDEIHRAGAEIWQIRAKELLARSKEAKLLGMTATPTRTDGRNMAEELCRGISYELKLTEAVARGILPVPVFVNARYISIEDLSEIEEKINNIPDEKEKAEVRSRYNEWLKKAKNYLGGAQGVDEILLKYKEQIGEKCIIFCKDTAHIEEMAGLCEGEEGWFRGISENPEIIRISYLNSREENIQAISMLRRTEKGKMKIGLTCEMLNEGYHDEDLITGILARPTKSEILFRQQLGRLLIRDGKTQPIVFDLANNLMYFKEFRREVEEIVRIGQSRNEGELYSEDILRQFKIISEELDFVREFEEIEENLERIDVITYTERTLDICEQLHSAGVDFRKIQCTNLVNGKQIAITIADILERQGIDKELLQDYDLDLTFKIGQKINRLRRNLKYSSKIKEKYEERVKAIPGLLIRDKEELLEICEKLKAVGVDFRKVQCVKKKVNGKKIYVTIADILERQGIDKELLQDYDLDLTYQIGEKISRLREKIKNSSKIKEKYGERIKAIPGLIKEKTLDICEMLREIGVDFTKVQCTTKVNGQKISTTIADILENQGIEIDKENLQDYGLDLTYAIGQEIKKLRLAYNGIVGDSIKTKEDRKRADAIPGLIRTKEKTSNDELLDICEVLREIGVDFRKVQWSKTVNGIDIFTTIANILESQRMEIDKEKLQEYSLKLTYPIGQKVRKLKTIYNGIRDSTKIEEYRKRADAIPGLIQTKEKTSNKELLDICEILREIGVDFKKVKCQKKVNEESIVTTIADILERQGIDKELLRDYDLDLTYPIGQKIKNLRSSYAGRGSNIITDEDMARTDAIPRTYIRINKKSIPKTKAFRNKSKG